MTKTATAKIPSNVTNINDPFLFYVQQVDSSTGYNTWSNAMGINTCTRPDIAATNPCKSPTVDSYGTGCTNGECGWVKGTGYTGPCTAVFYDENWTKLQETLASCVDGNTGTFVVPPNIRVNNDKVNVIMKVNGQWNDPNPPNKAIVLDFTNYVDICQTFYDHENGRELCTQDGYTSRKGGQTTCTGACDQAQCCRKPDSNPDTCQNFYDNHNGRVLCTQDGYSSRKGGDTTCIGACDQAQCCRGPDNCQNFYNHHDGREKCTQDGYKHRKGGDTTCVGECDQKQCCRK